LGAFLFFVNIGFRTQASLLIPQVMAGHLTFSLSPLKQRIPVLYSSVLSVRASVIALAVGLFSGCLLFKSSSLAQGSDGEQVVG
jgi:hypothetical protein